MADKPKREEVRAFIRTLKTWFDEGAGEDFPGMINLATRDHGSVGDETPGKADVDERRRIAKALKEKFPGITLEGEIIDEWVELNIRGLA